MARKKRMSEAEKIFREFSEGEIELADNVFVNGDLRYSERANLLVRLAIALKCGKREEGYKDNKMLVYPSGIESLIGAGVSIIYLNESHGAIVYIHDVLYKERRFIAVTERPYIYVIDGNLK